MSSLISFLQSRLGQLRDRKFMIPRYVERPEKFLGKKDFTMEDLPKIDADIIETKSALAGIASWKKVNYPHEYDLLMVLEMLYSEIEEEIRNKTFSATRKERADKDAIERVKKILIARRVERKTKKL